MQTSETREGASLCGCALFFFVQGLCASTWAARIPSMAHHLALSDAGLGVVLLCAPLASLLAMPWAGILTAKLGSRTTLRVSALYQVLSVCSIAWAPSVPWAALALLAYGVANTLVQISVNAQAVAAERRDGRSWMATMHGLWSVGGFAGAALAAWALKVGLGAQGHVTLLLAVVLALYAIGFANLSADPPTKALPALRYMRPNMALVRLGLLALAAMFCETAMFDWSGMFLGRVSKLSTDNAGLAYAAIMAAMAVGRFAADLSVVRFGLYLTLRGAALMTAMGLSLAVLWPVPQVASLAFVLTGLGLSPIVPLLMGLVGRVTALPVGVALAWASTIGFAGALLAPPLLGYLSTLVGLRAAFVVPVLLALVLWTKLSDAPAQTSRLVRPKAFS